MNPCNFAVTIGRLTKDPAIFNNSDGSKKVLLTIAAQDNFKGKDGSRGAQFVSIEALVRADKKDLGAYGYMHKGDLVNIQSSIRTNNYKDKNGEDVFSQVLFAESTTLLEGKNVTNARKAKNAVETEAEAEATPEV